MEGVVACSEPGCCSGGPPEGSAADGAAAEGAALDIPYMSDLAIGAVLLRRSVVAGPPPAGRPQGPVLALQGGRGEGFSCEGGRGATPGRSPMVAGAAACGGAGHVPAQDGIQAAADAGLRLAPPFSAVCRRQEAVVIRHGGSSRGQPV